MTAALLAVRLATAGAGGTINPSGAIVVNNHGNQSFMITPNVGFAIDDPKLATTFRHWAASGSGMFFDAKDAAGLGKAMADSLQPGYEIVDAKGTVVAEGIAGGEPALVPAGNYSVRLRGQRAKAQPVVVKPKETASVQL